MTRAPISRIAAAAGIVVLAGGCTLSDQDPPPLTGPSELAQSIVIAVSPDVLPQDGASQSFITVTARDANAQPIRNLTMRTETQVNGTPVDFGTLSARNVVTGSDGRATLVYTAPPSPAVAPDAFLLVDIVVTPFGSDFNNSSQRTASIRLVPQGMVIPPGDLVPAFTVTPPAPADGQTVLFDASTSTRIDRRVSMELRRWRSVVRSRGVARIQPAGHIYRDADARRPLRSNPVEVPVDHGIGRQSANSGVRLLADQSESRPERQLQRVGLAWTGWQLDRQLHVGLWRWLAAGDHRQPGCEQDLREHGHLHGDTPRDRQLRPDGDDQRHVADSAVAWQ